MPLSRLLLAITMRPLMVVCTFAGLSLSVAIAAPGGGAGYAGYAQCMCQVDENRQELVSFQTGNIIPPSCKACTISATVYPRQDDVGQPAVAWLALASDQTLLFRTMDGQWITGAASAWNNWQETPFAAFRTGIPSTYTATFTAEELPCNRGEGTWRVYIGYGALSQEEQNRILQLASMPRLADRIEDIARSYMRSDIIKNEKYAPVMSMCFNQRD